MDILVFENLFEWSFTSLCKYLKPKKYSKVKCWNLLDYLKYKKKNWDKIPLDKES